MCGIIFVGNTPTTIKGKKQKAEKVNEFVLNQYEDQSTRGTRGFGIIRIEKNKKIEIDRACEPIKFLLDLELKPATMILAHHRMPTSTENKIKQTHPIKVSNDLLKFDYYVVHNGVMRNDAELRDKHMELGFKYTTDCMEKRYAASTPELKWNDSEAIAVELALFVENKITEIRTDNGAAFAFIQVDKKTEIAKKVFFGKNGSYSNLNMSKTRGNIMVSSEGKGDSVKENTLYSFEIKDPTMKLSSKKIIFKEEKEEKPEPKTIYDIASGKEPKQLSTYNSIYDKDKKDKIITVNLTDDEKKVNKLKGSGVTVVRSWVDIDTDIVYDINYTDSIFLDKRSREDQFEEFSNLIEGEGKDYIQTEIETEVDRIEEQIKDILTNFKEITATRKLEVYETNFYVAQIALQLKMIETVTDIANDKYEIARKIEENAMIEAAGYQPEDEDPRDELMYDGDSGQVKKIKTPCRLLERTQPTMGFVPYKGGFQDDMDDNYGNYPIN